MLGPLLLKAWDQAPVHGMEVLAAFYATMVLMTATTIFLFAGARSLGPGITRILVGISAAALLLFGLYQACSGSAALLHRLG